MAKVLVVGAGAVGQVYAFHFAKGGAKVSFLVRPRRRAMLEDGLTMFPIPTLAFMGKREHVLFREYGIYTIVDDATRETWDQVWICTDSTALDNRAWLKSLVAPLVSNERTILVNTTPGWDDVNKIAEHFPRDRIVQGGINFISWQAPLANEKFSVTATFSPEFAGTGVVPGSQGMAYWLPPLEKTPFSGPEHAVRAIVSTLKTGGLPVEAVSEAPFNPISVVLASLLMGLEIDGWNFKKARSVCPWSATPGDIAASAAECYPVAAIRTGRSWLKWLRFCMFAILFRVVFFLAPLVVPFDIETYFEYHFLKVGAQMRQEMDRRLRCGLAEGMAMPTTMRMREQIAVIHGEAPFQERCPTGPE